MQFVNAKELIDAICLDAIKVYQYAQKRHIGWEGCLQYDTYLRYGKYKKYLTDYSPNGIINFASIMMITQIPTEPMVLGWDLQRVSQLLNSNSFTPIEYDALGKYRSEDIIFIFDSWESALHISLGTPKHNSSPVNTYKKRKAVPAGLRYKVLARDGFKCVLCGASPKKSDEVQLHVDHILPVSKGGTNAMENLRTLCAVCNLGKRDLTIEIDI